MKKIQEKINNKQSGQIIVFVGITLVVLLGFAGLAIDGGRLYNERRIAQGTADTVAFTAALVIGQYVINSPDILTGTVEDLAYAAALERASENGFTDADKSQGVSTDLLRDTYIFIDGPYYDDGIYFLVTVELESEIPPAFIQLVYGGPLVASGRAVAKARPRQNLAFGYSMFGSASSVCDGIDFSGTVDIIVEGGGVFSNSDKCELNCNSIIAGGDIVVDVEDGEFATAGCYRLNGGAILSPTPDEGAVQREMPPMKLPNCIDPIDLDESGTFSTVMGDYGSSYNNVHGIEPLSPGRYDQIRNVGGDLFLAPGLYCIGSGGLTMSTGTIQGNGVTLYFYDGGSLSLTGGFVDLSAPVDELVDGNGQHWTGMLIYMVGDGTISLGGNGDMIFTGSILALDPPSQPSFTKCDLNGNGDFMGFDVQLICYTIGYSGGVNSYLRYTPPENYYYPATIDLVE